MTRSFDKQKIPIFMYHSISIPAQTGFRPCTVSPEAFDAHLSCLEQYHYTPVTVTQFVKAMGAGGGELPLRPVILTFDDGYADFYTDAFPALQRRSFTATIYIATGFTGSTSRWLRYPAERWRPMLTRTQLVEISAWGIECGAHTHTHPQLDMLPPLAAQDEIMRSKELLEEYLGQQVSSFAYPYGYYTARLRQIVRTCGFTSACAIRRAMSSLHDNPYTLARLAVTPDTSTQDLATVLATGRGSLVATPTKRAQSRVRQHIRSAYGKLWYGRNTVDEKAEKELKQA